MSILLDYPDFETLMMGLARIVAKQLGDVLTKKGAATLAVPGGTTPAPFLERLSLMELDWAHVSVLLTDERLQPADPFRSNFRMVEHYLNQNASVEAHLLPMGAVDHTPLEALREATALYALHLPIDVLVVGMGADMHTASLFPDADVLDAALDAHAPPLMIINSPSQPETRLTLTAPVLAAAKHRHLLIAGAKKLAAFKVAEKPGPINAAPIRCVLNGADLAMVHYTLGT
ncbi:MAG: 6-phosphogluconolactonase [Rhodobacterales bacterium]